MAEDQGVNGDRWTTQASILLQKLGWLKVADSNIDLPGSDGLMHGIDALFRYEDGFNQPTQGIFLEAKRYATTSFSKTKLQDWVNVLNKKMLELRRSKEFNAKYPAMAETDPRNGLLVLWFHDLQAYSTFKSKLKDALMNVQTPRGKVMGNRLFVLSNEDILRLASLITALESWCQTSLPGEQSKFQFYYPSSLAYGNPSQYISVLNLEYMFSRFIVARGTSYTQGVEKVSYAVFYFGNLDMDSFINLKEALLSHNFPADNTAQLYLYNYQRNDEFRKIQPDVAKLFTFNSTSVVVKSMDVFHDLPSWMNDVS